MHANIMQQAIYIDARTQLNETTTFLAIDALMASVREAMKHENEGSEMIVRRVAHATRPKTLALDRKNKNHLSTVPCLLSQNG